MPPMGTTVVFWWCFTVSLIPLTLIYWNSSIRKYCPFLSIYYLFIQSFIYYTMNPENIYFNLSVVIQYYCYLSCCTNCSSFCSFRLAPVLFNMPLQASYFLVKDSLFNFLPLWNAPSSFYIFSAPVLESTTSPRSESSFYGSIVLETKNRVAVVLIATSYYYF